MSLSVETWFLCYSININCLILLKFFNKVPNHKRKVEIDFGDYDLNHIGIKDQNEATFVLFKFLSCVECLIPIKPPRFTKLGLCQQLQIV